MARGRGPVRTGGTSLPQVEDNPFSDGDCHVVFQIMGFSIAGGGGKKYRPEGEYSLETLQAFAQAMIDGTAKPIYKSAAIPGNPKDGDVTIVVGKNFDEIVKAEDKDVLLEVYAPW